MKLMSDGVSERAHEWRVTRCKPSFTPSVGLYPNVPVKMHARDFPAGFRSRERAWAWFVAFGECVYCGDDLPRDYADEPPGFQLDHVVPRVAGGGFDRRNRAACCFTCNNQKSGRDPEQWRAHLEAKIGAPVRFHYEAERT